MSITRRRFLRASTLAAAGATCTAARGTAAAPHAAQSGALTTPAIITAQAASTPTASYGGTLVATTVRDIETFDPAISYEWTNWSMLPNVFEGLIGFKPQSTDLVPLLAADMPTVSEATATTETRGRWRASREAGSRRFRALRPLPLRPRP